MTLGKPRYNKKYEWELLRLCTQGGLRVIGGASKLFKYFIKTYNIPELITGAVKSDPKELGRAVMSRERVVKVGTTDGGKNVEKEQPPEEGYSSFKEQNK